MSAHSLSRAFFLFFMTPTTSGAQQGAASVFLSSGGATSIHHNFFGWYDRRSGPEVNGRVSYVMRSNRYNALWYAADVGSWMAGDIDRIGEGVGLLAVRDSARVCESISALWDSQDTAARHWSPAPTIQCLSGAQAHAAAERWSTLISSGAASVFLTSRDLGLSPTPPYFRWLGWFDRRNSTNSTAGAGDQPRRPVYLRRGTPSTALWYSEDTGYWFLGGASKVGQALGLLSANDGALDAEAITATWSYWQGGSQGWQPVPGLRYVAGNDADASWLVHVASGSQSVLLDAGSYRRDPRHGVHHMSFGMYDRRVGARLVNGRASFAQRGRPNAVLWYCEESAAWVVSDVRYLGSSDGAYLAVFDAALNPEGITAVWQEFNRVAPPNGEWQAALDIRILAPSPPYLPPPPPSPLTPPSPELLPPPRPSPWIHDHEPSPLPATKPQHNRNRHRPAQPPAPPPPEDRAATPTVLLPAPNGGATAAFSLTGNGRDSASAKLVFVAVALCPFVMCAVLYRRYRLQRRRRELIEIAMDDLRDGSER